MFSKTQSKPNFQQIAKTGFSTTGLITYNKQRLHPEEHHSHIKHLHRQEKGEVIPFRQHMERSIDLTIDPAPTREQPRSTDQQLVTSPSMTLSIGLPFVHQSNFRFPPAKLCEISKQSAKCREGKKRSNW